MRKLVPALCLLTLAALAGQSAAKPPDLPDNPPIIVAPIPYLPPSAWLDASPSIFPPAPAAEYELTLSPEGQRLLGAAMLLNAHPFLVFLPTEPAVAQSCPRQPADRRCVAELALTRTVLENLEALEKATECLALAEKLADAGKLSEAAAALEAAQRLVPGSACARRAEQMLKSACAAVKPRPGGCEEAEGGFAVDSGLPTFLRQFGMCQMSGLCERVTECEKKTCGALSRPITLHCVNTPLGVVLQNLREVGAVNLVVDAKVCLRRPVCVHAERAPIFQVLEMVLRPMGYGACVCDEVVRVCPRSACCPKGCSECCEEDGRCDSKCCEKKLGCCEKGCAKGGSECCEGEGRCDSKCCEKKSGCCEKGCCKASAGPKMCGGAACLKCDRRHATPEAGVEEQVTGLMKACYLALEQEQYEKAADLARQARALDPMRVEGDPVLYKFSILGECGAQKPCPQSCPGAGRPSNNYPARNQPLGDDLSMRPKLYGVGVTSDAGLTGTVVVNERGCDCRTGSVFTKVVRTHGWELAKGGADALKAMYIAEVIPDDSCQQCLTFNLSTSGVVNVYCRTAHEGTVYNAVLKDGVFLIWTKPAAGKKAE